MKVISPELLVVYLFLIENKKVGQCTNFDDRAESDTALFRHTMSNIDFAKLNNNLLLKAANNRVLTHILFWLSFVTFYGLIWGSHDDNYRKSFTIEAAELLIKLPMVYFYLNFLIDRFLFKRRYTEFVGLMIVGLVFAGLGMRAIYHFFLAPEFFPDRASAVYFTLPRIFKGAANVLSVWVFVLAIKILKKWYQDQQRQESLEKEKLEAELKYLKSQVHPHFLFNTLNNLYSLTLKKSDVAPEVVLKLSELMSYLLYDATAPRVPLSREIQYLQNYIALEKIRYGDRLDVHFGINGSVSGKSIAPMLMLPFLENSFKHGASGEVDTVWITVDLTVKDSKLIFKVENCKNTESDREQGYRKGIGLENVRRRLDLIYGQENYDLKIFDERDSFLVVLKLELEPISSSDMRQDAAQSKTVVSKELLPDI